MKTLSRTMVIALAVSSLLLPAMAQPAKGRHRVDLKASQLQNGANEIAASGDLKLIAVVSNGKVTAFQVKDKDGKNMQGTVRKAAAGGGGGPEKLCKAEICVRRPDHGLECWDVYVDCKIVDTLPKGGKL